MESFIVMKMIEALNNGDVARARLMYDQSRQVIVERSVTPHIANPAYKLHDK